VTSDERGGEKSILFPGNEKEGELENPSRRGCRVYLAHNKNPKIFGGGKKREEPSSRRIATISFFEALKHSSLVCLTSSPPKKSHGRREE